MSDLVILQPPTPFPLVADTVRQGCGELTARGTLLPSPDWLGALLGPGDEEPYGKMLRAPLCRVFSWPSFFLGDV